MDPLKEERVAAALRNLADVTARRDQVAAEHREAALQALDAGASWRRVAEIGKVAQNTVSRWKRDRAVQAAEQEGDGTR
ncbi:helix-turn-helix domain-containing protein [Planomonospora sp. ID82291]|uniref:helix-turn-helix domain-containing protein n=1 Tax=Planomonospora sp. ID82291 TaxID=2738136 RepID=UPI0018C399AE|nr:helix-turn-helix domain-containing protein [Planomonospora sp. ID82291]MBG0819109.1 helix-turn-helix domain-containing protein [Planomonospora sp. ID82291]